MKHSVSRKKAGPALVMLPLMANVTMPGMAEPDELIEDPIEITGTVKRGLNIVEISFHGRRPVPVHFGTMALRAFLRLVAEVKLRGEDSIVTALDLQREGVLPWGTACGTMTEVYESIAAVLGGDAAEELLGLWWGTEEGEPPWLPKEWSDHFYARLGIDLEDDQRSSGSTIRQLLGRTRPRGGDKNFLRANGWRPDFAYLHGSTSSSKEEKSPDGVDLAYSLGCPASSLMYNRAALLKHDDDVVRQIAAILPI
jgi:hypothetical protein